MAADILLVVFLIFGIMVLFGVSLIIFVIIILTRTLSNRGDDKTKFGFYRYIRIPGFMTYNGGVLVELTSVSFFIHTPFTRKKEIMYKQVERIVYGKSKMGLPYIALKMVRDSKYRWYFFAKGFGADEKSVIKMLKKLEGKIKITHKIKQISSPYSLDE